VQIVRCPFPWGQAFFGLSLEYKEGQLEEAFALMMNMNMSYDIFYAIPVKIRSWFIRRLLQYKTQSPQAKSYDDMDTPLSSIYKDK
jgi:hypothetical protein